MKKSILIWAGWFPSNEQSLEGIFVKKHIELIAKENYIQVFTINHSKKNKWFQSELRNEGFGYLRVYRIPSFIVLKLLGYLFIPIIEGVRFKGKPDIFHLHCSVPFALFTYFLELLFIKNWIVTEHWSGFTSYSGKFDKKNSLVKYLIKSRLKRFDAISLVSEGLQTEMNRKDLLPKKQYLIPNCLKFTTTPPSKNKKSDFEFCTISRLDDRHKNISGLLTAFKLVVSSNRNTLLYIYGDGPDKDILEKKAESLDLLNKNVFFAGRINNKNIERAYSGHDAFVMFSNFETYSITTAEALTHGLPVIATKCGGPEYFVNDTNGILVDVGDIEGCTKAMIKLQYQIDSYNSYLIIEKMKEQFSDAIIKEGFQKMYSLT